MASETVPEAGNRPDAVMDFVARVAGYWEAGGLTHAAGAILGYLMVCEPAQQTQAELGSALSLSSGSVSTQLTTLVKVGFVERTRTLGSRTLTYQLPDHVWVRIMQSETERIAGLRGLADAGLRVQPRTRPDRISSLDLLVRFWEREWPQQEARFNEFARKEGA